MIFSRKRTKHSLEVGQEMQLAKAVQTQKTHSSFSPFKKIVGTMVALTIAATTAIVGVTMVPTPGAETASADWLTDLMCGNNQSENGIYGGTSSTLEGAKGRTAANIADDKGRPWQKLIPVSTPKALDNLTASQGTKNLGMEITALERYGYFQPTFESWKGLAKADSNNKDNPVKDEGGQIWYGSGGSSSLTGVGPGVVVKDVGQTLLYSDSGIWCMGATFSGGEMGNVIMIFPKFAIAIASTIYMFASNLSLSGDSMLAPIGDVIETMIIGDGSNKGLKDLLFLDFMLVMVMLGAVVVAWQGLLKGRVTEAIQSVGWMLLVGITGILFLTNPLWISNTMEKGLDIVETAVEKATLQTTAMSPECSLPNSADRSTERKIACSLWLNSIYKPWVQGQFGKDYKQMIAESDIAVPDPSTGREWVAPIPDDVSTDDILDWFTNVKDSADNDVPRGVGLKAAIDNAPTAGAGSRGVFTKMVAEKPLGSKNMDRPELKNWAFYQMHAQSNWDAPTGVNISEVAYNQLVINLNPKWKIAFEAVPNAFLSLIASAAPTVFMLVVGGTLISFQIILVVLIVLAPFFFTLGFFPGWGRRILMRWAELMASLFVKRIILVLFMFIFLKIYISILAMDILWTYQILFITILTIVALTQKEQITQMITSQINFGSYNSFGSEESMKQSAVGGIIGGYYAGKAGARAVAGVTNKLKPRKKTRRDDGNGQNPAPVVAPTSRQDDEPDIGGETPPPTPPPTPTPTPKPGGGEVEPVSAKPDAGSSSQQGGAAKPEDWDWQWQNRDEHGNLVSAGRYNEDGTGKVYSGGQTYTLMHGANGERYAVRDSDGRKLDAQTLAQLGAKREQNSSYAQIEGQQREIESMPKDSAEYSDSRAARAAQRDKDRARTVTAQKQAAIEASTAASSSTGKEVEVRGPERSSESSSTRSPSVNSRSSSEEIVYEYDPETNDYRPVD